MSITITLTAYNMGDGCDEADFDAWAKWVAEHVDEACGVDIHHVDQYPFASNHAAHATDRVSGGTPEQNEAVRRWLAHEGWEMFCTDPGAWPNREADAAS